MFCLYNLLKLFDLVVLNKVGDNGLVLVLFDLAVEVAPLGGEFDLVFVPGVQVEGGEGEIVFSAFAIVNFISFL